MIGSEAETRASFSMPFPGGVVSLNIQHSQDGFAFNPSHIAATATGLTTAIAQTILFIAPTTISCLVPSFTRASIATVVISQDLIDVVPPNNPRVNHDPVTLAPFCLLLEEARTNLDSSNITG